MPKPKQNRLFDIDIPTIREQIDNRLLEFTRDDILIAIPATVVKVDEYETKQIVDVKPVLDMQWIDGRVVTASIIKKVFVKLPEGGGFSIELPIAVGDLVTLHYSHKAISDWLDSEGNQLTQSVDYVSRERDCWVTHGFGTRKSNLSPSQTNFNIKGPNTTLTITPSGDITAVTEGDISVTSTGSSFLKSSIHTIDTDVIITGDLTVNQNLQVDIDATITGVTDSGSGVFDTSLTINTKELKDHDHDINSGSSSPGPTGSNN